MILTEPCLQCAGFTRLRKLNMGHGIPSGLAEMKSLPCDIVNVDFQVCLFTGQSFEAIRLRPASPL